MGSDFLLPKYQEWFEIVLYEHKIIREQNWTDLPKHVQRKEELMKEIIEHETQNPQWKETQSEPLRLLIHQLGDMEQLNHNLLEERIKDLKIKVDDIHRRQQMVRQLKSRYLESGKNIGKKVSRQG